jgi:transposase
LYTFITNKKGKGKQSSLVCCIKGTLAKDITAVLDKIPVAQRQQVKEITLDMAKNMESAARGSFPNAKLVTDRFHVVRLATEALQHLRVKLRRQKRLVKSIKRLNWKMGIAQNNCWQGAGMSSLRNSTSGRTARDKEHP